MKRLGGVVRVFERAVAMAALLVWAAPAAAAPPVGTAFTYQGRLSDNGVPANGLYDLEFQLFDQATGGELLGTLQFREVTVTGGLFTVKLDFRETFTATRWLEIGARPGGTDGRFTTLTPRQELTPTPTATFAATAATVAASGVNTAQLADGAVTSLKLGPGAVTSGAIAEGQVVKRLNGLTDTVTIAGSGGTTVSTEGHTITVAAAAPPADCTAPGTVVIGLADSTTLIGAGYTQFGTAIQESWLATATTTGVPSPRTQHAAVWTGTRMIVWGGQGGGGYLNTGGIYDPVTNSWTATATTPGVPSGRQYFSAVWTGSKMIVWGGYDGTYTNAGGQFDPADGPNGSWTSTNTAGAPSGRWLHTAVWTGSKMIVWGGWGGAITNTGGQFDPAGGLGGSWTSTNTAGAPSARAGHTAVWTGSKMIIWGGSDNTGGLYDPTGDSWAATATTAGVPSGRTDHTAVWTGSKMIVWGGNDGALTNTGGQYDPASNAWAPTATTAGVPSARYWHTAVWTGSRMIVWGGEATIGTGANLNTGGQWFAVSYFVKN
jgi:Kelch motif protein